MRRPLSDSNENNKLAKDLTERLGQLQSRRKTWENHWQEIAERLLPRQNDFMRPGSTTKGDKRSFHIYDATAPLALERFAAAMESMLTPRHQRWHKLVPPMPDLRRSVKIMRYLEEVNEILFQKRYQPRSAFASQSHEHYMGLGAFGTSTMLLEDEQPGVIRYKSLHLSETFLATNHHGVVDTMFRKYDMSAKAAVQKFGKDNLPEKILKALEKNPMQEFEFLHAVYPNDKQLAKALGPKGMPYASVNVAINGGEKKVLGVGGYWTFPYVSSRYVLAPREDYGRSPAMTILPDIKMINEMSRTQIRAGHRAVDPPLLVSDDGVLQSVHTQPGALNWGGVDENGRQMVQPMQTGMNYNVALDMMDQRRKVINDAFLVTLFQILVETPEMTATEAMIRAQEKGALLAPTMGRQQTEFLEPMIQRELDIHARNGLLPEMPDELMEATGGEIKIEYESPLSRQQRAEEAVGILRTLEAVIPLAERDPSVLDAFDLDEAARVLADVQGAPARIMRSLKAVQQMRDERNEQMQQQSMLEAAPVAAEAANKIAQAQKTSREAGF